MSLSAMSSPSPREQPGTTKQARTPSSPEGKLILWKRQLDRVTGEFVLGDRFKDGVEGSGAGTGDFAFACSGRVSL